MEIIKKALSQYGVTEFKGPMHNPEVVKYFDEIGHEWVENDETAWCSAFVNWVCCQLGLEMSNKLNARSWLNIGEVVQDPQLGDVVVFWREKKSSWKGHVGFYVSENRNYIYLLGGNQENMVKIKKYPKSRVLGYRRIN